MTILLAVLFGTLIGVMLGLIGGGGSILTVPILVYLLDQGVHEATATSLVIVGATALVGVVPHARAGRVAFRTALFFGGAGIAGAFAGTWLNNLVSGPLLLLLFGLLMLVVAARMFLGRKSADTASSELPMAGFRWPVLMAGLMVGVMTGFFGVGGGFLIVPALVMVLGFPMRLAVGTSLLIIAINSVAAMAAQLQNADINWQLALLFIAGGLAGATLGGRLAGRIDEVKLSRGFAVLVTVVGVYLIARNGILVL
ncbi:MAG: sulfite exporter TauE/SafE family protein [Thermomicrobiales bacterium]